MRKLGLFLFFLMLCAFVLEFSLDIHLSNIEGLSFKNAAIYGVVLLTLIGNAAAGRPVIAPNPVNIPAILFIAYCTLSLLLTGMFKPVPGYSLSQELLYFKGEMDPYVLLIIMFSLVNDERTIKIMLRMLVGVLLVFLLITVLTSFNVIHVGRSYLSESAGRVRGAFSEWNNYPLYVVTFMPLVTAMMLAARNKFVKIFYAAVLALCGYNALLAGSRGGLVSLAAAVGVYYLLASRRALGTKIVSVVGVYVIAAVAMLALSYLLPSHVADTFHAKISGEYFHNPEVQADYSSGRLGIWTGALKLFLTSPIYGTGWATFVPLYGSNSHNDYLLFLVTTGIIGLYLFVFVFVRMLKTAFWHRRVDVANRHLYDSFIAGMAAYMAGSFLVNVYTPAYFVFIYAALILRLGYVRAQAGAKLDVKQPLNVQTSARIGGKQPANGRTARIGRMRGQH